MNVNKSLQCCKRRHRNTYIQYSKQWRRIMHWTIWLR